MSVVEQIRELKARESNEVIELLQDDDNLRKTFIAFISTHPSFPNSECENIEQAWKTIDLTAIANNAGTNPKDGDKYVKRLIGLNLCYPDGSVHRNAQLFISALVQNKLQKILTTK